MIWCQKCGIDIDRCACPENSITIGEKRAAVKETTATVRVDNNNTPGHLHGLAPEPRP